MGELGRFLNEVRRDACGGRVFFNPGFLNNVGVTLEKRGFDEARLFLWDSHFREDLEKQAVMLLNVLKKMEEVDLLKKNRVMGGHVIKNMHKVLK